jgi:tRNA pseudouridine55 synthase
MNGLLVIDKPGGMTSRDVVNRVQRWFPKGTKVGHTGTLDPLATGVLVVCVGAATRLADLVQGMGKTYRSRFRLGARSDTDDADGAVTPVPGSTPPSGEQLQETLKSFVGQIEQVPPAYSALKHGGKRAHDLARRGEEVPLTPRTVRVDAVRLLGYDWPFADVEIDCGKGTYIRSIARDLGEKLGCGGLVETLRRTRVGPFTAEQGVGVDVTPGEGRARLLPMAAAAGGLTRLDVSRDDCVRLSRGQWVATSRRANAMAAFSPEGELIALGDAEHGRFWPTIVLSGKPTRRGGWA